MELTTASTKFTSLFVKYFHQIFFKICRNLYRDVFVKKVVIKFLFGKLLMLDTVFSRESNICQILYAKQIFETTFV